MFPERHTAGCGEEAIEILIENITAVARAGNAFMNNNYIALAGNPNCGKTSLFNQLTGGKQQIGNWPGVTVERKEGQLQLQKQTMTLVDLPGIYSLVASSQDEQVARDFLLEAHPSLILNVVDSTNLERNLYLTTQLLELNIPVVVLLNMADLAKQSGWIFNTELLSSILGVPVLDVSAVDKKDIQRIKTLLDESDWTVKKRLSIDLPNELEEYIDKWSSLFQTGGGISGKKALIRYLEGDNNLLDGDISDSDRKDMQKELEKIEDLLQDPCDVILANYRYGAIQGMVKKAVSRKRRTQSRSARVDKIVLHKFLGIPVFLMVMYLAFGMAMGLGNLFVDYFDRFFGWLFVDKLKDLLQLLNSPLWMQSILADGVGAGLQTVATFVPVIFFMFLILSFLEDSGYMARAAFITDRFMKSIGLPGKSFVPMLVGFGCTVPAIMATRTLEKKRDRYMTIFMVPFMSCGARFPVYAMVAASFFPMRSGLAVFSIYVLGILMAVFTGLLLKKSLFKGKISEFIMELPPYHRPRIRHILLHTWRRLKDFIFRAGKVIVLMVLVLGFLNSLGIDGSFGNENNDKSVLTRVGKGITPVFHPMGIEQENWPATVGLFTGIFAKEASLGTMNSLYSQISGEAQSNLTMSQLIREYFNPAAAYAFMIFVLIYCPCLAALAAAFREMGVGMTGLMAVYLTVLAWISSTIFYQIARGHQWIWVLFSLALLLLMVITLRIMGTLADKGGWIKESSD